MSQSDNTALYNTTTSSSTLGALGQATDPASTTQTTTSTLTSTLPVVTTAPQTMVLHLNDEVLQRIITGVADQLRTSPARLEQPTVESTSSQIPPPSGSTSTNVMAAGLCSLNMCCTMNKRGDTVQLNHPSSFLADGEVTTVYLLHCTRSSGCMQPETQHTLSPMLKI